MDLYIVRHGETLQNSTGVIQGQQQGELSPVGIQQAKKLAEKLQSYTFDQIYCSDLLRTKDTLAPFLESYPSKEAIPPLIYTSEIRERSCGDFEGQKGKHYFAMVEQSGLGRLKYRPPNGENFSDLLERTEAFLKKINRVNSSQQILIMSHGGTVRALLSQLLDRPLEELLKEPIINTSISHLRFDEAGALIKSIINNCEHLSELAPPNPTSLGIDAEKKT